MVWSAMEKLGDMIIPPGGGGAAREADVYTQPNTTQQEHQVAHATSTGCAITSNNGINPYDDGNAII